MGMKPLESRAPLPTPTTSTGHDPFQRCDQEPWWNSSDTLRTQCSKAFQASWSQVDSRLRAVERKVITAAELERMSPAERDAAFEASIVWDLADAPPELVARARSRVEARIEREERQPAE